MYTEISRSLIVRRESKGERAAWSKHFGLETTATSKYANERSGKYASKYEAKVAGDLSFLEKSGAISELKEQVSFTLLEGKNGVRSIRYVADFTFMENGKLRICDAKGYAKNAVYKLKKKMMKLIHGLDIEEL